MKYVLDFSSGTITKELFVSSVLQVKFGFGEICREEYWRTMRKPFGIDRYCLPSLVLIHIPVHSAACAVHSACNPQKGLNETSLALPGV